MCVRWISSSLTFWSSEPCRSQQSSTAHVKSSGIFLRGLTLVSCALWSGQPSKWKQKADTFADTFAVVRQLWLEQNTPLLERPLKLPAPTLLPPHLGKRRGTDVTHCSGNWDGHRPYQSGRTQGQLSLRQAQWAATCSLLDERETVRKLNICKRNILKSSRKHWQSKKKPYEEVKYRNPFL